MTTQPATEVISVCETIGDSLFYVLYDREPRLPIEVKLLPKEYEGVSTSVLEHRKRIVNKWNWHRVWLRRIFNVLSRR